MTTTTPPARTAVPARPIVRPLWERNLLFQEPAYPDGLVLLEDEDDEADDA